MTPIHILVDFENVQPSAGDIALVRDEHLRLAIFRGPGQMKYSADVAEAWQPLGARVSFIRCAKAGRNASDMHIAFYLGELVAAQELAGSGERARFVIVSRDTDFDPLLMHIRAKGYDATRVSSLKSALNGGTPAKGEKADKPEKADKTEKAGKARAPRGRSTAKAAKSAPAKAAAKKSVSKKAPAKKTASAAPAARKSASPAATPAKAEGSANGSLAKVIDSLRRMGERRPAKRAGLERHIESHLGRDLEPGVLVGLMDQLERDGLLSFDENKVKYHLPKAKR